MTNSDAIWAGEALRYAETRPTPPPALIELLTQWIQTPRPALVVDLGCGTGLSTFIWGERAEQVLGIDPSQAMLAQARIKLETHPAATHISFQRGLAHQTGLASQSVDLVTCAQAFHWMEPSATLAEIARILRPGGVFAAYDYDWPPTIRWELEQVFCEVDERFEHLVETRSLGQQVPRWSKEQHLTRMRASGLFRFTRELELHHCEMGDAARFLGLIMTGGYSYELKQGSVTEQEIEWERLKQAAADYLGAEPVPWYFSYRVRLGLR